MIAWAVPNPGYVCVSVVQESSEEEESDEEDEKPAAAKGTKRKADAANGKKVSRFSKRVGSAASRWVPDGCSLLF